MKRFCLVLVFLFLFLCQTLKVNAEPFKILSMNYDNSSSVVYMNVKDGNEQPAPLKLVRLSSPNRIYFDVNNAVLIGEKQQLEIENSDFKEIKLAQFSTDPNVVRMVITFEEGYDTSNVKLMYVKDNIIVKCSSPKLQNEYFNPAYDENTVENQYSSIVVNSQGVQKVAIPQTNNTEITAPQNVMEDIQKAFKDSNLNNSDGKSYEAVVSVDISTDLKLRTKYFINGYYIKTGGLLVSGLGQITAQKIFYLDSPKRVVIDLPNTYVDKKIRNRELSLCSDGSCKDTAKIGQFERNKARIVVNTETPEKYIPIFSADSQSLFLINADKLKHTTLVNTVANLKKTYINNKDSNSSELILSFTAPVVYSIARKDNSVDIFVFNVRSYNEQDLAKTVKKSAFKNIKLSLLPEIGIKATIPISKADKIQLSQGVDGRALRFILNSAKAQTDDSVTIKSEYKPIKNKVVLDAGHGGSDYGAIREGINEKDITLDMTQRVAAILKSKGYKVALTRNEDESVSLQERVEFSENETPEIFVSIHVNSAVATEPMGIETHYYHEYSKELAQVIQDKLIKSIDTKNRGIIKSKFYVINHTSAPAVLVETGFISNPDERAQLVSDERKNKTAKAIADGIIEYLKKSK